MGNGCQRSRIRKDRGRRVQRIRETESVLVGKVECAHGLLVLVLHGSCNAGPVFAVQLQQTPKLLLVLVGPKLCALLLPVVEVVRALELVLAAEVACHGLEVTPKPEWPPPSSLPNARKHSNCSPLQCFGKQLLLGLGPTTT